MKLLFLLALMHFGSTWGLKMCKGPFKPPKFVELTANPIYEHGVPGRQKRMAGAFFSLKVKVPPRVSFNLYWWQYRVGQAHLQSTEDNPDFRSNTKISGDEYESQLHMKVVGDPPTNITELTRYILINMQVNYGCGSVEYVTYVRTVMHAIRAKATLATITEMPQDRNLVSKAGRYELRVGLTNGKGKPAPNILEPMCFANFERRGGVLSFGSFLSFDATNKTDVWRGITEADCLLTYDADLESVFVQSLITIKMDLSAVKEPDRIDAYDMRLLTNLRRRGIKKPAILLEANPEDRIFSGEYGLTVPTREDVTPIACFADASDNSIAVELARVGDDGDDQWLKSANVPEYRPYPSLGVAVFNVKSPSRAGYGEMFVCRARGAWDVVRQTFILFRHDPVRVVEEGYPVVRMKKGEHNSYNISCEATGMPQPDIRFYWSGKVSEPYYTTVADLLDSTNSSVIRDSDLIEVERQRTPWAIYATIVLKDVDTILENLPKNYWDENSIYSIRCSAFNEITFADRRIATYRPGGRPGDDYDDFYQNYYFEEQAKFWASLNEDDTDSSDG